MSELSLADRLEAWSTTICLTVDKRNRLEWHELSPLGIDVSKAAAQLRAMEWVPAKDSPPAIHDGEEKQYWIWYQEESFATYLTFQGGLGWLGKDPDFYTTLPENPDVG